MISPTDLAEYISTLRTAGVTGPVTIDGVAFVIPPPPVKADAGAARAPRSAKADYDRILFACTEGIPDDDETTEHEATHE